jgi:hypothetical protein
MKVIGNPPEGRHAEKANFEILQMELKQILGNERKRMG